MNLIRIFIERPIFLLMIEIFLIVLGIIGYQKIGVDLYPEIEPPVITVTTEYPGAGPSEVESLVSKVIEEEINQIGGIERLISTSRDGLSQVVVEFKLHLDAKEAQTDVREKVLRARPKLPAEIEEPLIQRKDFADRPILNIALKNSSKEQNISPARMRNFAENDIKPMLQQVNGVGQVDVFGGRERQISVFMDKQKLLSYKLTPKDVANAIKTSNINIPSGEIKEQPVSRSLRVLGEFPTISEISNTVVKILDSGQSVILSDVAKIIDDFKEEDSFAYYNGSPVVMIEIKKQSGTNTVEVSDRLAKSLNKIEKSLPNGMKIVEVYDGARRIKMSVSDVFETMVIAAILAVVVVFVFLGSVQSTFITGISLPTVIVTSMFALWALGFTLNIMTLLGLTLAVGLLLDDAIVVRENIWKKIEEGMPPKQAAFDGTKEVFIAVIATSLTVLATFIPVAFIPGIVGKFFAAFALTVCVCVVLSTFDAITVAPTLSAYMVAGSKNRGRPKLLKLTDALGEFFVGLYVGWLKRAIYRPWLSLAGSAILFFGSLVLVPKLGFTFLPADDSGEIEVKLEAPAGTTIEKTTEIAQSVAKILRTFPETQFVSTRVGNDLNETNIASIFVKLVDESQRQLKTTQFRTIIQQKIHPLTQRENVSKTVGRPGGGGGPGKPVQMVLEGGDINVLNDLSNKITSVVAANVPDAINLESNLKPGRPEIQFQVLRSRASALGVSTSMVGDTLRGLYEGEVAGVFREDGEEYDIRVMLDPASRTSLQPLENLTLKNFRDELVPLTAVATQIESTAPSKMVRIDQKRAARIEGDLAQGAALGNVIEELKQQIIPLLPQGYYLRFQGQAESLQDLKVGAMMAIILGALFIYMIMASLYESLVIPFSILLTLPLAIIGAILALFVAGRFMDVYAIIGMILLMGLVTKNAILLVDYIEQLRAQGISRENAILQAGQRRLRPIMMTTIAMIAGMLPVALGSGELNKVRIGMGIASIGGLISSTLLSLLVVPCFYIYLDRLRRFVLQKSKLVIKRLSRV